MKVVLFCGGFGLRLRDYSEKVPKPMGTIGPQPILWNIMKYYAHHGHKDFILCLGYKADVIKNYFLTYNECLSNDFVLNGDGTEAVPLNSDIRDWRITFVDTGMDSNIGMRLLRVKKYLEGEAMFLAHYADTLTDAPLNDWITLFEQQNKVASFMSVNPNLSLHTVTVQDDYSVASIDPVRDSGLLVNGGYFVFRRAIFDHINDGEELVEEPFQRLIRKGQLMAHPYKGFWATMDTFKDRQRLEELYLSGHAPWQVWKDEEPQHVAAAASD